MIMRSSVFAVSLLAIVIVSIGCSRSPSRSSLKKDIGQLYAESEARERAAGIRPAGEVPEQLSAVQGGAFAEVEVMIRRELQSERSGEMEVLFSDGRKTGYRVAEYTGDHTFCAVSFSARFIKATGRDLASCEAEVFAGLLAVLYERNRITFSDMIAEQLFRKHQREGEPSTLYEQEYEQFLLWKAQQVTEKQISLQQFRFEVVQKERQLAEALAANAQREEIIGIGREQTNIAAASLNVQKNALNVQRNAARQQAVANAFFALSRSFTPQRNPIVNCKTTYSTFGNYSTTSCH